ncbi:MAG: hypothetical protein Q9219_003627 [cf. Caloplaca sp. 3 TL-2023]
MLRDMPIAEIPKLPRGPLLTRDFITYRMLNAGVSSIFSKCLRKKGESAKFGWARPGISSQRELYVLITGADSQIDRDIPPGPEPQPESITDH